MQSYNEPVYLISVVANMLEIHPQTLRQYEREGLIEPSRTEGRMRLYSQGDNDKMKLILRLTRDMGINLAGVDVVLRLREQMQTMEDEIESLRDELRSLNRQGLVPVGRAIVKRSHYDIVIFDE